MGLKGTINTELPQGVTAQLRTDGNKDFIFLMNFTGEDVTVELDDFDYEDLVTSSKVEKKIILSKFGIKIITKML